MCIHYWLVDAKNRGICRRCGKRHDFVIDINRVFGYEKTERFVPALPIADYYIQGSISKEYTIGFDLYDPIEMK